MQQMCFVHTEGEIVNISQSMLNCISCIMLKSINQCECQNCAVLSMSKTYHGENADWHAHSRFVSRTWWTFHSSSQRNWSSIQSFSLINMYRVSFSVTLHTARLTNVSLVGENMRYKLFKKNLNTSETCTLFLRNKISVINIQQNYNRILITVLLLIMLDAINLNSNTFKVLM